MSELVDSSFVTPEAPLVAPSVAPDPATAVATYQATAPELDPEPDADAEPGVGHQRRNSGRAIVLGVLAGVLLFVMLLVFLLPLSAQARQQHLRDEYRTPASGVASGEAAMLLQIPAIGLDQVVTRGAEPAQLQGGPGWREGSAPPGQGNTVILGHLTLWSYPFGNLSDLQGGTRIYLRTRDDRVYLYKVTKVERVDGDATDVMQASGPTRLTLITSAGGPFDSKRTVVQATAAGPQPEVPDDQRVPVSDTKQVGSFDERPPGGAALLVVGFLVMAVGVVAGRDLRGRYSVGVAVLVAGPAVALGVVLVLFHLDAFLPVTY